MVEEKGDIPSPGCQQSLDRISSHQTQPPAQTEPRKETRCWRGRRRRRTSAHDVASEKQIYWRLLGLFLCFVHDKINRADMVTMNSLNNIKSELNCQKILIFTFRTQCFTGISNDLCSIKTENTLPGFLMTDVEPNMMPCLTVTGSYVFFKTVSI